MKAYELSVTAALSSVFTCLDEHGSLIDRIPALVKAKDKLGGTVTLIGGQLEILTRSSGAAAAKEALQIEIEAAAFEIAGAVHSLALDNGDIELATEMNLSLTDIGDGRADTVMARCTNIVATATENLEFLADYNITQAKLTALTKKIAAFEKQSPKPRQGVTKRKAANKAARRFLKQGRALLNGPIDKLVAQFRETQPEFYAEYKAARKIVRPPTRSQEQPAAVLATTRATNGTSALGTVPAAEALPENGNGNGHSEAPAEPAVELVPRSA